LRLHAKQPAEIQSTKISAGDFIANRNQGRQNTIRC
jgi:hypothetical protein